MSNTETLEKVIQTTDIGGGGGGLLNAAQTNTFIDYMWDATVLGSQVRSFTMKSSVQDIDKVGVGKRLARVATEAVDDGVNAGATWTKISITTVKLRLDWELSTESLEDNLEGEALEEHIARLMATQFGNDIEDLAINGDTTLTGDPLLKAFNGWQKRALAGAHVLDAGGSGLDRGVYNSALKAMPRNYMQQRPQLKFFTGSGAIQDYLFSAQLTSNQYVTPLDSAASGLNDAVRTEGSAGFTVARNGFGLPTQEVPLMLETVTGTYSGAAGNHTSLWLTFPQNLLWGIKREVEVYRQFQPKKDTIEYTVFTRVGNQIENLDAFVITKNIKVT